MSSLFIHLINFKITIANLSSKFCISYRKSWYFPGGKKFSYMRFLLI